MVDPESVPAPSSGVPDPAFIAVLSGDEIAFEKIRDRLLKSDRGAIKACEYNAQLLIASSSKYRALYFDEFLARPCLGNRDWTDDDDLALLCWLQSSYGVPGFALAHARHGARVVAFDRRRDSLRDFIDGLPEWDGTPRIEQAFHEAWGAPDNELIRAASRNLFVAMIARALCPGAQVDTLWTWEGPQGGYKSRSLRELGGGRFHAEISATVGTTDYQRELLGIWLAEHSELDSLRGREASTIKRLLSAPSDRFVQKFQLYAKSYPRRAIAVASTNEATYWQDSTGARRLVPIPCGEIRIDLIAANRLQWFAEAKARYAKGATWWEFPAAIADAQEERQQGDPWEDALRHCIANGRLERGENSSKLIPWPGGEWISSAAILRDWLAVPPHQQAQAASTRLGRIMRRLGYRPKRSTSGNERGWVADTCGAGPSEVSAGVSATLPL